MKKLPPEVAAKPKLFFWLTDREADALITLALHPVGWPTYSPRTWKSLADKGLVKLVNVPVGRRARPPVPTHAGVAAITLTTALRQVNQHTRVRGT